MKLLIQILSFTKSFYHKVPGFLKNRYALAIYIFLGWITFFDSYNLFRRMEIYKDLNQARQKKQYYIKAIAGVKSELDELFTDNASLEKFAREQFYMKKEDEEIIIILDKKP